MEISPIPTNRDRGVRVFCLPDQHHQAVIDRRTVYRVFTIPLKGLGLDKARNADLVRSVLVELHRLPVEGIAAVVIALAWDLLQGSNRCWGARILRRRMHDSIPLLHEIVLEAATQVHDVRGFKSDALEPSDTLIALHRAVGMHVGHDEIPLFDLAWHRRFFWVVVDRQHVIF
ncbi:hypothetical protein D3C77_478720 [compost metagenome]